MTNDAASKPGPGGGLVALIEAYDATLDALGRPDYAAWQRLPAEAKGPFYAAYEALEAAINRVPRPVDFILHRGRAYTIGYGGHHDSLYDGIAREAAAIDADARTV